MLRKRNGHGVRFLEPKEGGDKGPRSPHHTHRLRWGGGRFLSRKGRIGIRRRGRRGLSGVRAAAPGEEEILGAPGAGRIPGQMGS